MKIAYKEYLPSVHPTVYVAEGAKLVGDVTIAAQSSVWFNAVLRGDMAPVIIGEHCNIQDNVVGHVNTNQPLVLAEDVSVGHSAIIHGCTIGKGTLIGMGAIVLNGAEIGEYALVGAGSIITERSKIPPYTLALGSPARVVRELTAADLERMALTTQNYVEKGKQYQIP